MELPGNKIYFRNLDSIRFFAALLVYIQHGLSPLFDILHVQNPFLRTPIKIISNGGVGVSIFFVLSGFLITYIILSEIELTGKFSVKNFYIRRVLRIWPLYFAVVIFAFGIYPYFKSLIGMYHPLCSRPGYYFTFLSNFDTIHIEKTCPGSDAMMQNITWSVAIEEQFYAFWPLIFAFLPRRFFIPAILTVGLGSIVFRFVNSSDNIVLYFHTFSVFIDLATGALFAALIKANTRVKEFFSSTNSLTMAIYFILFFVLVGCNDLFLTFPYGLAIQRLVYAICFAFVIASQSMITKPSKLELGNIGFAKRLGKYTYGIYLLHPIALTAIDILLRYMHQDKSNLAGAILYAILGFVLTIAISIGSYNYFEKRFLKLKVNFSAVQSSS